MSLLTLGLTHKSLNTPDEILVYPRSRLHMVTIGEHAIVRARYEPGWRWSEHIGPLVGSELCVLPHLAYHLHGRLRIRMSDGTEIDARPGDLVEVPPGHDAWVVGSGPAVLLDLIGGDSYTR